MEIVIFLVVLVIFLFAIGTFAPVGKKRTPSRFSARKFRYKPKTAIQKGIAGERRVSKSLNSKLDTTKYRVIDDLTLPTHTGTTQIDHIVVSRYGVFVVETKNMSGWIFGGAAQRNWTQVVNGGKTSFRSPIHQNIGHLRALQNQLNIEGRYLHNIVAFAGEAEPKTEFPDNVTWDAGALINRIEGFNRSVFSDGEVSKFVAILSEREFRTDAETRRSHIKHVQAIVAQRRHIANCPRCGEHLIERANQKTGEIFLGCSRFPRCRGNRKFNATQLRPRF